MSYADNVRRGVALLDEKVPGWHERIDLGELRMASFYSCILGQLADAGPGGELGYQLGVNGYDWRYGFDTAGLNTSGYGLLDRLWSYVVRQRQAVTV